MSTYNRCFHGGIRKLFIYQDTPYLVPPVIRWLRDRTPPDRQHSFVAVDHEIFSTVILSLPLIQEEQLPVSGGIMCTILVNH